MLKLLQTVGTIVEKTVSFSMMVKLHWWAESLEEDRPSSEEPQQQAEVVSSELSQGSLEPGKVSTELGVIEFQRKKIHNRCIEFLSRDKEGGRAREGGE